MFGKKKKEIDEDFVKSEITKIDDGDVNVAMRNHEQIADKIINSNMLKKYAELGKVMYGMLRDYRKGIYTQVPWFTIATIAFAFLYILNPLDIVPDFIPGLGYIDDFAVLTFGLRFIESDLHNYLDWKLEREDIEAA
ncbi:YkvA family protein [Gramella jeungdoensis]|uniref:YkvA family protein n=1 Tax=Gramella jeungdoensis TaxID=708091 RepID=A0ABT0YZ94_9FLAO|nr:YkvA family protein [Gramella jeungdoensis]MCM8567854.1 YkvA family protein [Gramella jeungdoensis]